MKNRHCKSAKGQFAMTVLLLLEDDFEIKSRSERDNVCDDLGGASLNDRDKIKCMHHAASSINRPKSEINLLAEM